MISAPQRFKDELEPSSSRSVLDGSVLSCCTVEVAASQRGSMPGKAKTQKHTAKELKAKEFDATVNRGGGAAGVSDRKVRQQLLRGESSSYASRPRAVMRSHGLARKDVSDIA